MKREGGTFVAEWGRDGKTWDQYETKPGWGQKVKVGVVVENMFKTPFTVTFDQYTLTQPKK